MPLPNTFPQAPRRPPPEQPVVNEGGTMNAAWLSYFAALDRFNAAVRARLDEQ